jgi:lysophospholipase L1-like esterase
LLCGGFFVFLLFFNIIIDIVINIIIIISAMGLLYKKFILFGDSITEHSTILNDGLALHPKLQELYLRKLDVLARGYGGYNSTYATVILPEILQTELNSAKDNIPLMTIFFGTNDVWNFEDELNHKQAVTIEQYQDNLEKMIKMALANNIKPIIIGPGLHDNRLTKIHFLDRPVHVGDGTTNERNHQYSKVAQSVATSFNVAFVDIWNLMRVHANLTVEQLYESTGSSSDDKYVDLSEFLYDGVHYTKTGYQLLYQGIKTAIETWYPELLAENFPIVLPQWHDIDVNNVKGSIFKSETEE